MHCQWATSHCNGATRPMIRYFLVLGDRNGSPRLLSTDCYTFNIRPKEAYEIATSAAAGSIAVSFIVAGLC